MDGPTYAAFLEGKLNDEHAYTHLLEEEVASLKEKVAKLLRDIAALRKAENELRTRSRQAEERVSELQMELKRAKEVRNGKAKEAAESRERLLREAEGSADRKQIFRSYLDNTFPRNKGTIKKLLKAFFVLEEREDMQPLQKIKFYQAIFEGFVKRLLDWLFPRKTEAERSQTIAQNLIREWKGREQLDRKEMDKSNAALLKEAEYVGRIEKLESEMLLLRSSKSMVESRLKTYERGLQIKGGEFVVHLKKMLQDERELEPESHQRVEEIIALFSSAARPAQKKEAKEEEPVLAQQVPLLLTDKPQGGHKRKAAPVLKKNIYGYYQEPQFAGNYALSVPTRHANPHKHTQTLPEDLCVLTLHPVLLLTLIDGSIKPQRTRHSSQFFVRVRVNEEAQVESAVRESLEPVWNEPFLLKDYDFPFLQVALMHKSKGLRDYAIGGGRVPAGRAEEKVVSIRKEKEFQGRVRFSLAYPKGNIYEFKITSVRLEIPGEKLILKEETVIKFPYNPHISVEFVLPEQVAYLQRSVIILESSEESMTAQLLRAEVRGGVALRGIVGQEGNKEVVVEMNGWKVVIQGELYLLICEEEEPEAISEDALEGGRGKYFSVRAPPPIVTVTYADILLHSTIKFPLVFALREEVNRLSLVKEKANREITEESIEPIVNREGFLRLSEFIKAPGKIYKFFIETLEGEEVRLRHESHLFERLLKEVQLQVSYREDEAQEVDYGRKNRSKKERLFKEFAVESKELMLNHYKVFSRHFKRIGFVKFKLGYTIYDNQLAYQSLAETSIKDGRRLEPIRQGMYFIELELSEAHLTSKSAGSTYRCMVNGEVSSQKKGNHPHWGESFIVSFEYLEIFEVAVSYEVWEDSTFSKSKIYEGTLVITDKVMALGTAIINLDPNGQDCLHFSRISVPSSMMRLSIGEIDAELKENADWIGKIDPYITLSSKNRQLVKTEYLDNNGNHPVWTNINKEIIIARPQPSGKLAQEDESFLQCKVYDYDLIGRDDYLGEVRITARLNPELMTAGQCEIMYGNLVKENFICGSVRLKGSFEQFTQQKINFELRKKQKLTKSDTVYRVSIYRVKIHEWKQFKDDRGIINVKVDDVVTNEQQFDFNTLQNFHFSRWVVNSQTISIQFKRQYKSFFKIFTESVGAITITTSGKQLKLGKSAIINAKNQEIGVCEWYSEAQDKIRYASFGNFTSCKQPITVSSDLSHELSLSNLSEEIQQPFVFYHQQLFYHVKTNGKTAELACKGVGNDVYGLYMEKSDHMSQLGCFTAEMNNTLQAKLQERSERTKNNQSREYKQLTNIHWEPYQYQPASSYEFNLKFNASDETITLKQNLNQVYNDYLVIKPLSIPVIFNFKSTPTSVEVVNSRTRQVQAIISVQEYTKMFVPSKGVFYYKIEDYNLKSILELQFKHILIRFRDQEAFKNCKKAKLTLTSSLSLNFFSCELMPFTNSFLLEDLRLLVAEPPHSATTLFFEAQITDQDNRQVNKLKFGFRLETNKEQYRIVDNNEYTIQALFSCISIERNYVSPALSDNTIYGMSFIDLQEIQFQVNEDPSARHIFVEIGLSNQYQKVYLERVEGTNVCRSQLSSVFFIEQSSMTEITIIEEGVLSNTVLGSASVTFSETFITKQRVSIHCEVLKDRKIIGRLNLRYSNLKEISFVDVNMFTYISRTNAAMVAELHEFGPNKQKQQKLTLTSRGEDVARLESEDSFIVMKDVREYEITVNERDTNKLLGEFKLCNELQTVGERITVLQPLRTNTSSLNGILIIEYVKKQSNNITWEQNKDKQTLLVDLSVSRLTLKKHYSRLSDSFAVRLTTPLRENKTKMALIGKPTEESCAAFTINNNQSCEIALLDKNDIIGTTRINPPYFQSEQRVIILTKDSKSVAIFTVTFSYLKSQEQFSKMREITSIQASNLIDSETFSKMTPFIELQCTSKRVGFATELGLGKEKIFWKVNLITADAMRLTVKDKDMFFDDFIGNAVLELVEEQQSQDKTYELILVNQQEGRKEENGILKVATSPVAAKFNLESITTAEVKEVKCFMLQLGGLVNHQLLKAADCIEVSLGSVDGKVSLLQQFYDDLYFYLSNKDLQIQFDTYFTGNSKDNLQLFITLYQKNASIYEQIISSKVLKQGKDLFTIYNLVPLQRQFYYFEKIYLWMLEKIPPNLQIYLASHAHYEKLHIVTYQKYLIVLQPYQLCSSINPAYPFTIILREGSDTVLQLNLALSQTKNECKYIVSGGIVNNSKSKEMGFYYAEISKFTSKGERQERRTNIGKSRRKWLNICICEAILTKDLEIFSKMDPYCKFGPIDKKQAWRSTLVQDNIGLHPIWNESFFIELDEEAQQFGFMVMDEEVTADRAIGEGKIGVRELLGSEGKEVKLFYGNDSSGSLRVQAVLTSTYIIFRNKSAADEGCQFYLFHQANKQGDLGAKIELGVPYVIDVRKEIKIKVNNSVKSLNYVALKEQQLSGLAFVQQCAWLHFDIYE